MDRKSFPSVSVAMCTYNGERFIREQLDSLINQNYGNLEIIIVDDCSSDRTHEILNEYSTKDPRIRLHFNSRNIGFKRNFEKALELCSGDFIALCDQDDIWFPNKISSYLRHIGDRSLIYSGVTLINQFGQEIDEQFPDVNLLEGNCTLGLLFGNCVTGHASMIRKDLLLEALPIPPKIILHDHWLAFVASASKGIVFLNEPLSFYRKHESNAVFKKIKFQKVDKIQRRLRSFNNRMNFLKEAANLSILNPSDKILITEIINIFAQYNTTIYNLKLSKLLRKRSDILSLYKTPEKARRKICRGLILDLF